MLGQKFDTSHRLFRQYCLEVLNADKEEVVLKPRSLLTRELVQLTLDLKDDYISRARLKVARSILVHPRFSSDIESLLDDYIGSLFPSNCRDEFESWVGQTNPNWQQASDKLEVADYSLASRVSQNWLQVEGVTKGTSSWWKRITGR